jgi:hypothetical protein
VCVGGVTWQQASGPLGSELVRRALSWIVRENIFASVRRHGNTGWLPEQLVVMAVLWVWSSSQKLTEACDEARRLSQQFAGRAPVSSYQGMTKALVRYTSQLMPVLWLRLRALMEQAGRSHWRIGRWLPLAVDGSRVTAPRTKSNERAFAAAHYGQGSKARSRLKWKNKRRRTKPLGQPVKPQVWLTLLWHMGLKMPWGWRCGASTASERGHLLDLLAQETFPEKTLFCGDAGFVGYELWQAITAGGHSFLIRVGANIRLLKNLGEVRRRRDIVYFWPRAAALRGAPPLVLRLLAFQTARGPMYLITNVLEERELTFNEAARLYRLRWGVELQFRSFKQTFGRGKLRSRTPQVALVELEWSLLGLWMIQLLAVKEQLRFGSPPEQSSVALALAVIRTAIRGWREPSPSSRHFTFAWRKAVKDSYQRRTSKRSRYRPGYKDVPSTGKPNIIFATPEQRRNYSKLKKMAA